MPREEYLARFAECERLLREAGYKTCNPARFLPCRWPWLYRLLGYNLTLLYDLWRLSHCELIYKMPGWKESRGATMESCWAYALKIWTLPFREREKINEQMTKFLEARVNPEPEKDG